MPHSLSSRSGSHLPPHPRSDASLSIEGLRIDYGSSHILDGVDLEIPRGSLVAVLGPSGCGKTTLLRAIAGLLPVADGTIRIGGRMLSSRNVRVAPERRGIGWVPQDAALFPHLTVGENIAFGLPRRERAERMPQLAALVGLTGLTDRAPSQLSGGQAQRVALARALAPRPDVILLDEPFAALDPQLRGTLRQEVAELLRSQQSTALLVTHDQEEALSLADYVAIMRDGKILQWGTPAEVYTEPASRWIAGFVGDTVELEGRWEGDRVSCALGTVEVVGASDTSRSGDRIDIVVRPEWLHLGGGGTDAAVTAIAFAGHDALVTLELATGEEVNARVPSLELPRLGDITTVGLRHTALAFAAPQLQ